MPVGGCGATSPLQVKESRAAFAVCLRSFRAFAVRAITSPSAALATRCTPVRSTRVAPRIAVWTNAIADLSQASPHHRLNVRRRELRQSALAERRRNAALSILPVGARGGSVRPAFQCPFRAVLYVSSRWRGGVTQTLVKSVTPFR